VDNPDQALQMILDHLLPLEAEATPVDETCGRLLAEDVTAGVAVVPKGLWLRPQEIGLFASSGIRTVPVTPRPRVAILETREDPANRAMLVALVRSIGCPVEALGVAGPHAADIEAGMRQAKDAHVFVILTGGGADEGLDLALTLQRMTVRILFGSIPMTPGQNTLFGLGARKAVFGLSKDPVGALAVSLLFLEPALQKMSGQTDAQPRIGFAICGKKMKNTLRVRAYEPVRLEAGREGMAATSVAGRNGPDLATACRATAFAILEPGCDLKPGDPLSILLAE